MGNICSCCLKSEQDGNEPNAVETVELLQPRAPKSSEREIRSYDSILESATSNFLVYKSKGKPSTSDGNGIVARDARAKLDVAVAPVAQSPPSTITGKDLGMSNGSSIQPIYSARTTADRPIQAILETISKPPSAESNVSKPSVVSFRLIDDENRS